jgi:hypothetical protein
LLYTDLYLGDSSFPLLYPAGKSDQILKPKVGSTRSRDDEWIGRSQAGSAGGQKALATVLIPVVDAILTPLRAAGQQFESVLKKRMVRVGYAETWGRIATLKCI